MRNKTRLRTPSPSPSLLAGLNPAADTPAPLPEQCQGTGNRPLSVHYTLSPPLFPPEGGLVACLSAPWETLAHQLLPCGSLPQATVLQE